MAMYWSGLSGAFLLDDTPSLNVINQLTAKPSLNEILNLAATGFTGVFGRSLSIFSFLLQHESWPDPRNFKVVNLLIHLLNGGLLALCGILIGQQWRQRKIPLIAIAILSFIWLAHPIQVSAVLYVVQRMTLLSATFSLLSIIFYHCCPAKE
jgi:protein O-mannosyl-transferase